MDSQKVTGDSDQSTTIGQQPNAEQADASSTETVSVTEARAEKIAPYQERSDAPDIRLNTAQHASKPVQDRPLTLDEIIKENLIRVLRETRGNRRRTAIMLGISRSTLYRMLERYGIDSVGRETKPRKARADRSMASGPTV